MKHLMMIVAIMAIMTIMTPAALAEENMVSVDISKLDPETAKQILEANSNAISTANEWADVGIKIGQAMSEACKELSIGVNDFVETPVGKMTAFLIVWKVIGQDLWQITGGVVAWVVISMIILWSFRFFHMSDKVITYNKDNAKQIERITYVPRYEFRHNDNAMGSAIAHVISFALLTVACMVIVFS